ncbi:hypothetical protein L9W97_15820, partial [Vibrio aestuarianus]|uniref:hypothetical protein n=1 Tax=Vibrio aestuarianus TaxID=28171 RepID=UPI00237D2DAD
MKIVNVNVNVTVGLLIFLFFLVLCVPTTYIEIKAIVLMLVLMGVSTNILLGGLYISRDSLVAIISFSFIGLIYSFYGQINGNLGAFRVISIQVIWPLLYLYISTLARHKDSYRILFRVFLLSLIFTVVYTYIYLGHAAGLVPDYLYFALDLGQNVGFYDGFVEYELYSITSLIFLIPIVLHYSWDLFCLKKLTVFYFLLCLMSIVLVFLTGRKALWLVIAI